MSISRRNLLHRGFLAAGGVLAASVSAQAQTKVAQNLVQYQATPKEGHSCATCKYFQTPNACQVVEGSVSTAGWCTLWAQKS